MATYEIAKGILQRAYPSAVFRPQTLSDWQGEFSLPDAVAEYFTKFGPVDLTIDGYGNPYTLPSLARLWSHQVGYRIHGITHEHIKDWDDDWLVIADEGADPFIYSRSQGNILHAFHGDGVWKPRAMFKNLVEMANALAVVGDIVATAGEALTDEDFVIFDRYRIEANTRISTVTGSRNKTGAILSMLGWG